MLLPIIAVLLEVMVGVGDGAGAAGFCSDGGGVAGGACSTSLALDFFLSNMSGPMAV